MDAKDAIKQNANNLAGAFLDIAKDGKTFVCPVCGRGGSGSKHRDGLKLGENGVFGCFSCDAKGGDIIDLYRLKNGVDYKTAIAELGAMMNIVPEYKPQKKKQGKTPEQARAEFKQLQFTPMNEDFRGIRADLLNKYGVKNCQQFKNPLKAGTIFGARKVVVFPTSDGNFFVRAREHKDTETCDRWDVGGKSLFNAKALQSGRPVFVVEGVIDALSVIQMGGEAVAVSGKNGIDGLVTALKQTPSPAGLLLAADNDKAGQEANELWKSKLDRIGVECEIVDVAKLYGGRKDANEALQADKQGLEQRIIDLTTNTKASTINPWAGGVLSLCRKIEAGEYMPIPTGIKSIDGLLGGGFTPEQLAVIGAPPAMGKTAFCQWLIESMAMNKPDFSAMYFCYEMSREQMQARGASRIYHADGGNLSALEIMHGKKGWRDAVATYRENIADKVAYMGLGSGLFSSSLEELIKAMQDGIKYQTLQGNPAPFVVVDYLQLVDAGHKDETENLKSVMKSLKSFAVANKTVVIGVVANNREANKQGGVSMYSGRGGSSIEYGADMTIGLAYTEELDKLEEVTHKDRRSIVLTKGRFLSPDGRVDFAFNGKYSEFMPLDNMGARTVSRHDIATIESLLNM
jgi:replicative DNA helicase